MTIESTGSVQEETLSGDDKWFICSHGNAHVSGSLVVAILSRFLKKYEEFPIDVSTISLVDDLGAFIGIGSIYMRHWEAFSLATLADFLDKWRSSYPDDMPVCWYVLSKGSTFHGGNDPDPETFSSIFLPKMNAPRASVVIIEQRGIVPIEMTFKVKK